MSVDATVARKALTTALNRLIAVEPEVTKYDTIVGDGDCGIGLKRGAECEVLFDYIVSDTDDVAILQMLDKTSETKDVLILMQNITQVVKLAMDGTSGAIYAIFLNALIHSLRQYSSSSPEAITAKIWADALSCSLESLNRYTPAKPGDRTLMDALYPFVEKLSETGNIGTAAKAADEGAQRTKGMKASLGRTVYVGGEGWETVPDPGAHGLAQLLLGLDEGLKK